MAKKCLLAVVVLITVIKVRFKQDLCSLEEKKPRGREELHDVSGMPSAKNKILKGAAAPPLPRPRVLSQAASGPNCIHL